MPKRKRSQPTSARLNVFSRGVVWGAHSAGMPREEIRTLVKKKDGTHPTLEAIDNIIATKNKDPEWIGSESSAGGRPSALSDQQKKRLVALVFRERGKAVVTTKYCKQVLPYLRPLARSTVCRALHEAGLKWLTRRLKTAVPASAIHMRLEYCDWILARHQSTLARFAYTDGTTFYLARGPEEHEGKKRVGLGKYVWRMASGKDGLLDANVGSSLYAKGQGLPVKIWGLFANGRMEYYLLPQDVDDKGRLKTTNMNGDRYEDLINSRFAKWRRNCFGDDEPVHLIQDWERCLWQDRNVKALRVAGCPVLQNYPKCSPDLNAIEGWWHRIRQRLEKFSPETMESRSEFVQRLRRTVTWLNENSSADAVSLCTNQKVRARQVKSLEGARCKW